MSHSLTCLFLEVIVVERGDLYSGHYGYVVDKYAPDITDVTNVTIQNVNIVSLFAQMLYNTFPYIIRCYTS